MQKKNQENSRRSRPSPRSMASWRLKAYRIFQRHCIERWVLPRSFSQERLASEASEGVFTRGFPARHSTVDRAWFHASSVGELESLWSVIGLWVRDGSVGTKETLVSVFSESARGHIERLSREICAPTAQSKVGQRPENPFSEGHVNESGLLYAGFSPWEGRWKEALERGRPSVFVTAKYEAWPELWASLSELGIPLVIVGAKARSSLQWAKRICRLLGSDLPSMTLLTASEEDVAPLREIFPEATIVHTGDPRWDRVKERASRGSSRAKELISGFQHSPKPWGVLGSVWPEDLKVLSKGLVRAEGTLCFVPHRVDGEHLSKFLEQLEQLGIRPVKTSEWDGAPSTSRYLVVDEMGFLSELYSAADWVYVGGGFGQGVHSTIEPAIHGVPLLIGPTGAERFPEIAELRKTGQLTLLHHDGGFSDWVQSLFSSEETQNRLQRQARWRTEAQQRLGAAERVLSSFPRPC